jgi:hypothetical protein
MGFFDGLIEAVESISARTLEMTSGAFFGAATGVIVSTFPEPYISQGLILIAGGILIVAVYIEWLSPTQSCDNSEEIKEINRKIEKINENLEKIENRN